FPGNSGRVPGVDFRPHQRRSLFRKSCCHDFCFHVGALDAAAFSMGPAYATGLALFFRDCACEYLYCGGSNGASSKVSTKPELKRAKEIRITEPERTIKGGGTLLIHI